MTTWHSVCVMSRASSSPRRVGLIPTMVAPLTAAAPSHIEYSGTLSSRTPTCGAPSPAIAANSAARAAQACTHST